MVGILKQILSIASKIFIFLKKFFSRQFPLSIFPKFLDNIIMLKSFRNAFLTGLLAVLPLGITVFILVFLLNSVGAPVSQFILQKFNIPLGNNGLFDFTVNTLSTILVVFLIAILGYLSSYVFGKFFIRSTERVIGILPFIRTLYRTAKQIIGTFSKNRGAIFEKAVLVEFPRKGIYSIGFLTGEAKSELQLKTAETVVSVFVPTTPNPTSGFLLYLPKEEVKILQMTVADALKCIISGGVFTPEYDAEAEKAAQVALQIKSRPIRKRKTPTNKSTQK